MIMVFFSNNAWNTMLSITGVMVLPPYLASTAYLWKISSERKLDSVVPGVGIGVGIALASGVIGSLFAVWLIYAAGLKYLLLSCIFLALGIPVFIWAKRQRGLKPFTDAEKVGAGVLAAIAVCAVILMATGTISLGSSPAPAPSSSSAPAQVEVAPMTKRHGHSVLIHDTVKAGNMKEAAEAAMQP